MKKILLLVVCLLLLIAVSGAVVYGINSKNTININGKSFTLKYSNCDENTDVCMNEYYLKDEYDTKWTELFTIVYAKKVDNPIAAAATMVKNNKYSNIYVNQKDNSAIAEFGIMYYTNDKKVAIEQNVAKVMKYAFGEGIVSQQYARRYVFEENLSYEQGKNDLKEFNSVYSKEMINLPAQKVYLKPLQKW